jgi:hypothetical protein
LVEQVEIEIGEIVDRAEPVGARRMAEAGMTRRQDPPTPPEAFEKQPVLPDLVAAVQKQERRPLADPRPFERQFADRDFVHVLLRGGPTPR